MIREQCFEIVLCTHTYTNSSPNTIYNYNNIYYSLPNCDVVLHTSKDKQSKIKVIPLDGHNLFSYILPEALLSKFTAIICKTV